MNTTKTYQELLDENEQLRWQLGEATETIQAIRTGQIDALVLTHQESPEIYTLLSADRTYRVFIETMSEGALTLNQDQLIVYSNSMFARMMDLPLSAVLGQPFEGFVTPDCLGLYKNLFEGAIDQKVELTIRNRVGHEISCLLSMTLLNLDEGTAWSLILTDLTAQKQAQYLLKVNNEQLVQTNTALEISNNALVQLNDNLQRFAYVASHDLQEPLRKIRQFGSLLRLRYAGKLDEQGLDLIERMERAAQRMSELIRAVLAYSRVTAPTDAYLEQSLNEIISEVLTTLEIEIEGKTATIDVEQLGHVPGDAVQLTQLFQNLLTNALKFTNESVPARIQISRQSIRRSDLPRPYHPLTTHESFCAIQVKDNGIGFDAHQADRIFGTFQRLHNTNQYPGTGIGLAIAKKVVENHYGYITAHGEPGRGATFTVYLPV